MFDVIGWETAATYFPWAQVQYHLDGIDLHVYQVAVDFAQEDHLASAKACPECGRAASELFWFSVTDPEPAWDAGTGRVGFLTLCRQCRLQVDFLVDQELTDLQTEQWRECRTLA